MRLGVLLFAANAHGFLVGSGPSACSRTPGGQITHTSQHPVRDPLLSLPLHASGFEMAAPALSASRRLGKILPSSTVFFACDVQERFRDLIFNMPAVISTARFLIDVSQELEVPCIATEQYPKALLHTVPELNIGDGPEQTKVPIFAKKLFSMCTDEVMAHVDSLPNKPKNIVLFGIETHVCVTQTCLDLLELGYDVHVVCDGVSSQKPHDRAVALQRMQQVGAFLTTAEQVAFQLLVSAENAKFKAVSNLVKKRNTEGINTFSTSSTL